MTGHDGLFIGGSWRPGSERIVVVDPRAFGWRTSNPDNPGARWRFDLEPREGGTRTRETIEIIRAVTAGERLDYHGEVYDLPLTGAEGRAIRALMPPTHLPTYVASLGPANLRLTGELADGWIGTSFFPETADVFLITSATQQRV